ncbi:AMP-binding protein [Croceitalea vernalis]|uniref:AMP-binding protein n=1 Tax=Croceitalea vernalis TaxID=3075599 RepID=A0ABU3BGP1_9FLAO|nr:AMP-binding protein [Croceitalea sp. P007]MDT0621332.1 AMP-binding protein [Croceitalea sp. P007]
MMLHPQFKLNGIAYNETSLLEVSTELVKEGNAFEKSVGSFLIEWFINSDVVNVTTSGSTGTPKQITLKKKHMVNSALATGSFFNLKSQNTALLCLSADFIAGKMMLVRAMVLGLELDVVEPSSSPLSKATKCYDFCAMVPMQVENSLRNLKQIDTLIIGGAPLSDALSENLQNVETNCFETYGMTETITHVAVKRANRFNSDRDETYFNTLPNISISKDERGCLVIEAPKISNKTIITNDMVELIDSKRFKWLGRYDTIINSGGVKLIPEQIEKKLNTFIKNRFFVAGIPDDSLGQKVVLVLERTKNRDSIKDEFDFTGILSKYETPKEIIQVDNFIKTKNGKINREETILEILN